ncbi:MAG: hypothetical protein IMX02_07940 [Limnochordaceae bacterium]|nr:hypothetical protein [Limnochordaceae bacterium]
MKKLALVVSAVLVAAMAAPALAQDLQISGSMESNLTWRQQQWMKDHAPDPDNPAGVSAATTLKLNAVMGSPERGVRAFLQLAPLEARMPFAPGPGLGQISVERAFVEANGKLWEGGPNTTARLGSLDVGLSPYIATFDREGLSISGLGYGPVSVSAFVGRDAAALEKDAAGNVTKYGDPFTVSGAQVRAELLGATGSVTAVNVNGRHDWEIGASGMPMPWINVSGTYARSGEGARPAAMTRLDAEAAVMPNLTLNAEYRNVEPGFDPAYQKAEYDPADETTRIDWLANNKDERGVVVGVHTVQQGVDLKASLDHYYKANVFNRDASVAASTTLDGFELAASGDFRLNEGVALQKSTVSVAYPMAVTGMTVTPKYEATIEPAGISHELSAEATVNAVPQLPGIGVAARVKRAADSSLSYGADVSYTAPNGLSTGIHYDTAKGAWAEAGLKAEF